ALAAFVAGRRFRPHNRWVSYRFLAERLRSAFFLALVLEAYDPTAEQGVPVVSDSSEEWLARAFREIWVVRPPTAATGEDFLATRQFLADVWFRSPLT